MQHHLSSKFQSDFKVSIIGCGNVGSTAAYALLLDGTPSEIALISRKKEQAQGLVLDFEHSLPFVNYTKVVGGDDYALCKDSHIVIITAGNRQQPGQSRLELVENNKKMFEEIIPKIVKYAPESILMIVSNPVDILTYHAWKISGFPKNRVFGTGTLLDTARFRFHLSEKLDINPKSIEAFVLGEHGDSSFPVFSSANIAGKSLFDMEKFNEKLGLECYDQAKNAASRIINDLGYTCYSIATVIRELVSHIFQNSRIVLPLSVVLEDYYEEKDIALSVPCILDSQGIVETVKIPLNEQEEKNLHLSAQILQKYL